MKGKINEPKTIKKSLAGFISAARKCNPNKLRQLLDDGVKIEKRNKRGQTALMQASIYGRLKCAELLLGRGADVNAITESGTSAIAYAYMYRHDDIMKVLLDHGANVDVRLYGGKSLLMNASQHARSISVALLLERGADVTLTDNEGKTALDYCTSAEIRKLLEDAANATNYVLK